MRPIQALVEGGASYLPPTAEALAQRNEARRSPTAVSIVGDQPAYTALVLPDVEIAPAVGG